MTSRRQFLAGSVVAAFSPALTRAAQLKSIGVQLYTVRTVMPQKPAETLDAIRAIGYQEIGLTSVAEITELIQEHRPVRATYSKDLTEVAGGLRNYIIVADRAAAS